MKKVEEAEGIKITRTGYDPETGRVSSKVEYFPQENVKMSLARFLKDLKRMVDKNPKDLELKKKYNKTLALAREIREHIVVTYD